MNDGDSADSDRWKQTRLGDILTLEYGKALRKKDRHEGIYPVYGSNGIVGYHDSYLVEGPGVIVGRKGSAGKVVYSDSDFWPIDTTYYVSLKEDNDLRYFFYFLGNLNLESLDKSTAIPGLNRNDVYRLEEKIPPIQVQKQIAKYLDRIKENTSDVKQELARIPALTRRLRMAILSKAFWGELLPTERSTWESAKIRDVVKLEKKQVHPNDNPQREFNYLSIGNIESDTGKLVDFSPTPGIEIKSAKLAFTTENVLYSRST